MNSYRNTIHDTKRQKQPRGPSVDERIKKKKSDVIHTKGLLFALKSKKVLIHATM